MGSRPFGGRWLSVNDAQPYPAAAAAARSSSSAQRA